MGSTRETSGVDETVEVVGGEAPTRASGSISADATLGEIAPGAAPGSARRVLIRAGAQNDYHELVAVDPKHYVVGNEIARGGMGRILSARDRRLGRTVAIKELLTASPANRVRFEREVRITARLQHPAIVNVLEAGEWPGSDPFFAMKLVAGESLDRVIAQAVSLEDRLALLPNVIAVVEALAYAHAEHVIHRDLKPSNVLVGAFGETVVIDWGLAKDLTDTSGEPDVEVGPYRAHEGETVAGAIIGTPAYMPPEQASGDPVDQRADVYALGAILYHTLSGTAPFTGLTAMELLSKVVSEPPPSIAHRTPGLPRDLVAIVDKAMAFAARDRYPSAKELASDLKKFQTGQLVGAHRYSPWQLVRRWLRRNRAAVVVAVVATAVLVGFGITSVLRIVREQERTEQQRAAAEKTRGQAEDLMGFMLGDLKEKLAPVGKLPLLEVVARKALAYYAERPEATDPIELQDRATALMNIGEVFLHQGAFEDARPPFVAAMAIRQRLIERDPTNARLANGIAVAHQLIAEVYRRQGKLSLAIPEYQAMVAVLEVLVAREPTAGGYRYLLASGLDKLGWMEKDRGNLDAALALLRRSRELRTTLDPTNTDWRLAVSVSHDSIGSVLEIRGDLAGAITEYRASAAIRTEIVEREPANMARHFALALSDDRLGAALAAVGDSPGALEVLQSALRILEKLTARDDTNAEWGDALGMTKSRIGDVLLARGETPAALAAYKESEAIHEDITKRDPSNLDAQYHLAITYDKIGYLLKAAKNFDGALAKFQASKAIRERRSALDPTNVQRRRDISISLDGIGEVLLAKGERALALATYRGSLALAETTAALDPQNADWQRDLALAHQMVGDVLLEQADATAALGEFRAAETRFRALVAQDTKNTTSRRDLAAIHYKLGDAILATKDVSAALVVFQAGRAMSEALVAEDPTNAIWLNDLSIGHDRVASTARALGDRGLALEAYRAALAISRKQLAAAPTDAELRKYIADLERSIGSCCGTK